MFKVMIRDNMSHVAKEILEATGKIEVTVDNDKANAAPEVLSEIIREYDGLALRSGTKVPESVLENCGKLKVIGRAGVGVDNIDIKAATRHGVVVMNAPGGNTTTTAEHAIALLMSLARNIPQATASLRSGKWEKKLLAGVEMTGKTLGIVGLGHIGRVVAERARGLKMKVIASDPYVSEEAAQHLHVELVSMYDLVSHADFITLHVPRLPETANMVDAAMIAKMKPGVRIVNASRGEVVNLDDLHEALQSGHVAGAALDVFPKEPPDYSHPIFSHPNVIFTPPPGRQHGGGAGQGGRDDRQPDVRLPSERRNYQRGEFPVASGGNLEEDRAPPGTRGENGRAHGPDGPADSRRDHPVLRHGGANGYAPHDIRRAQGHAERVHRHPCQLRERPRRGQGQGDRGPRGAQRRKGRLRRLHPDQVRGVRIGPR